MISCAFWGSFQIDGSSERAFSSARRRTALSQSKMPPQQSDGLLHVVDQRRDFSAHDVFSALA
jgi:hypothetical protein